MSKSARRTGCRVTSCGPGLQAFDEHLNMVLGDVEESHTTVDVDSETGESIVKVRKTWGLLADVQWISVQNKPICPTSVPCTPVLCKQTQKRSIEMLFVRGDVVVMVAPPVRSA